MGIILLYHKTLYIVITSIRDKYRDTYTVHGNIYGTPVCDKIEFLLVVIQIVLHKIISVVRKM